MDLSRVPALALAYVLALLCISCTKTESSPFVAERESAIIGGENETGYPAVGSLIEEGFLGLNPQHKCSSVLIKPDWVITAAHCLKGDPDLKFSIGPDAKSGTRYDIDETFTHPRYDDNPIGSLYDVALIHLKSSVPASKATPMPYNTMDLAAYAGASTLYVGYGSTSGTTSVLGLGRKRRTSVPIEHVDLLTFSHAFDGTGVCFGDSGGPGLVEMGGDLKVAGVVSAAFGCQGGTCDPCSNGSKSTRIDRFADWIAAYVGDAFESCATDTERCLCAAACASNGVCDNAVCGQESCGEVLDCLFDDCADSSDGSCSTRCLQAGTISARETLRPMVNCWGSECRKVPGSANEMACIQDACPGEWQTCEEHVNPPMPDAMPTGPDQVGNPGPMDAGVGGDASTSGDGGTGQDAGTGTPTDAGTTPDAGGSQPDAAAPEDAATQDPPVDPGAMDAGVGGDPTTPGPGATPASSARRGASGCAVASAPTSSMPAVQLLLVAVGACLFARRRRR